MAILKCKMCGGELNVSENMSVAECEFCGTKQTVPTSRDENLQGLFNRANVLRMKSEFDKAAEIYEKIIQNDETQAEAHWGLILCKYGIEYVEDPQSFKRIPTCHRTSFDSVIADDDYKSALSHADAVQREIYESEAKEIDRLQKDILSIVHKEEPFDVFICYKETGDDGKRTQDSAIANDIYHQLTQEGLKVFYAAITLENKLGTAYEPYIFAALNSAKVMLVIGTKPEYFNAVWVKNEWSRFLKLIKKDHTKLLIPCYRDMDAYELPEEFAHLQAQDMGKIGFINDVMRGIKKVVKPDEQNQTVVKETIMQSGNANIESLLKRAFMFLEDGEWDNANEYCEKVLDIDPENAEAYLGNLMAEMRVRKQADLRNCSVSFESRNNYQKIMRFGNEKLKTELQNDIEYIKERNENARLQGIFTKAKNAMSIANTEMAYKEAAHIFESISEYKYSKSLEKECYKKAEEARKDAILANGKAGMTGDSIQEYESAIKLFESISGWKDADEQIVVCQKRIEEIRAKEEANRLEAEQKAELERLEQEKQEQIARAEMERIVNRNRRIAIVVCAIIAFIVVLNSVIIPKVKYNKAVALMNEGNFAEAYETLKGYKNSEDKANSICVKYEVEKIKTAKVGDYVKFGKYEQDNNIDNGKEEIEWLVLDKQDNKVLVISKYALDCKPYNTSPLDVTWETCTLRKWLNGYFIDSAFSDYEKAIIPTVTVLADKNPEYSTNPGNATEDQVFLLSVTEAYKYFSSAKATQCTPTTYAVAKGFKKDKDTGRSFHWLRSPGEEADWAACIGYNSNDTIERFDRQASVNDSNGAVRPALWIDLSAVE